MSHSTRALAFALISLCLGSTASAATYRCVVDGTVHLTDRPCAPAALPPEQPLRQRVSLDDGAKLAARREAERSQREALQERCSALREALHSRHADTDAERATKRAAQDAYNAYCLSR